MVSPFSVKASHRVLRLGAGHVGRAEGSAACDLLPFESLAGEYGVGVTLGGVGGVDEVRSVELDVGLADYDSEVSVVGVVGDASVASSALVDLPVGPIAVVVLVVGDIDDWVVGFTVGYGELLVGWASVGGDGPAEGYVSLVHVADVGGWAGSVVDDDAFGASALDGPEAGVADAFNVGWERRCVNLSNAVADDCGDRGRCYVDVEVSDYDVVVGGASGEGVLYRPAVSVLILGERRVEHGDALLRSLVDA